MYTVDIFSVREMKLMEQCRNRNSDVLFVNDIVVCQYVVNIDIVIVHILMNLAFENLSETEEYCVILFKVTIETLKSRHHERMVVALFRNS